MSRSLGTSNDGSSGAQDANFEQIDGGSLPENSANGGTAVDDIRVTTTGNRRRYPLTEWSKRKYAAEMQMKREMETERRANETVAECGAQVTRNRQPGKPQVNQFESLVRINDNRLHSDNSGSVDDVSKRLSLDERIKVLESNLKKLHEDLIEEKNRLAIVENPRLIVKDRDNFVLSDGNTVEHYVEKSNAITEKDHSNSTESVDKSTYFIESNYCYLPKNVYETPRLETRLTACPENIEFRVSSNATQRVSKQHIKVTNRSKNTILCRYSYLLDPNSVLRDDMSVIKVKSVTPCRLRPAMMVEYQVTFKPAVLPSPSTYLSLENVRLVFECSNERSDVKTVFHVPVNFRKVKPEPELVTETITFPPANDMNANVILKKYLILKNNGDADCMFSVLNEAEYRTLRDTEKNVFVRSGRSSEKIRTSRETMNDGSTGHLVALNRTTDAAKIEVNLLFEVFIGSIIRKIFRYFRWRNNTNVLLPAKGSAKVPVIFNQNFAYFSVSESFVIAFDNTDHDVVIPDQRVNVIGRTRDLTLLVRPDVIDVGLCYLTISEQVVSFLVQNNSRVMMPFEIRLPSGELSRHVKLSQSKGYLRANSSLEVFVRLRLKYDIMWSDDCAVYFDVNSGFLEFPILVSSPGFKTYREVRILAVVTTPFGLQLTPDRMDFGTVNTTETVVRSVALANHSRTTMAYGFLDLPEMVSIYPTAFGIIFSGENICLHVHYSPKIPKHLPRNVHIFEDDFILTCRTITGLNAEQINSEAETTEQNYETASEVVSTLDENNKSITSISYSNELDHGPDKIQIQRLTNSIGINALNRNAVLKDATIECHARIHEIPVELSVQKIIFEKTQYTSFSIFNIDLRASNLFSAIKCNIRSFLDFKIRFEFVSDDPSVEFKPKNGILQSEEVIKISVILRPKFDHKMQNMFKERLDFVLTNIEIDQILKDGNYNPNLIDGMPNSYDKIKIFEANRIFYSTLTDRTKIVSAVCFVQFVNKKSIEYFGFHAGSLKLSVVCPTTKPNIILFADQVHFGECTMNVRHDQRLFVLNVTKRPVPLKISPLNPIGPFFCSLALNGKLQSLSPGIMVPIIVSFTPERESTVKETVEVTSETTRLTVKLYGSGLRPSCDIMPDDTFNIIQTTKYGQSDGNRIVFRVTNTSGADARFNVQLEWSKQFSGGMTDDEAYEFEEGLRLKDRSTTGSRFDGPDWKELGGGGGFDLGNDGRPLWFRLNPNGVRYVTVTFKPPDNPTAELPPLMAQGDLSSGTRETNLGPEGVKEIFWRHVYVAKINVHVGQLILRWFYMLGFVLMKTPAVALQSDSRQ